MKSRDLLHHLKEKSTSRFGRIVALTGARQTGKTTLVRHVFADYEYVSLDDPQDRARGADGCASPAQVEIGIVYLRGDLDDSALGSPEQFAD
jgi:hypothetical protein